MSFDHQTIKISYGAWQNRESKEFFFPKKWLILHADPQDAPALTSEQIEQGLSQPIGTPSIEELAKGKKSAVIAVDDITRPTPAGQILPSLLKKLIRAGIQKERIIIIIATGAHRPIDQQEMIKKLSSQIYRSFTCVQHDFMADDIQRCGWIDSGPVDINPHFLNADLKLCLGGVMPHGETGFGGAAKLVVPGVAGYMSIAHLHGALSPREIGVAEGQNDRRAWIEKVANFIGVDAVICTVINTKRQLAGVFCGDLIKAHREACQAAAKIGKTVITKSMCEDVDVLMLNTYPLDTDPVQMGKVLRISQEIPAKMKLIVNAASDGIFYHGMGMGGGVNIRRLLSNVPNLVGSRQNLVAWLRGMKKALRCPKLVARFCYFSLNQMSYVKYDDYQSNLSKKNVSTPVESEQLVYSPDFPQWGFQTRYSDALLLKEWSRVLQYLENRFSGRTKVLLFPCAPLQLLEFE